MSELKFIAIFSLIPIAFLSLQIAIFLGVLGVLIWLFFFAPKPNKSRNNGNSITDNKAGEPPMV